MTLSKRKLTIILVLFFLFTLVGMVYRRSASEYNTALGLQRSGREIEALDHYDRALRWYLPFNYHARRALEAIWEIGENRAREGKTDLALEAYRNLRGGIQGTRSFYTPYRGWLLRVNEKIADMEASLEQTSRLSTEAGPEKGVSLEESRRAALDRLNMDHAPSVGWSIVTEVGFVGWVFCAAFLALTMNIGAGDERKRKALKWGLLLTVFFAFWLTGMALA